MAERELEFEKLGKQKSTVESQETQWPRTQHVGYFLFLTLFKSLSVSVSSVPLFSRFLKVNSSFLPTGLSINMQLVVLRIAHV